MIQREFGGYIYRRPDGTFSYTPGLHGYKYDMRNLGSPTEEVPKGIKAVGSYHTHGDYDDTGYHDPESYSDNDMFLAHRYGIPSYLGTPLGKIMRYDPYPNESGGYERTIGRCRCEYVRPNGTELW